MNIFKIDAGVSDIEHYLKPGVTQMPKIKTQEDLETFATETTGSIETLHRTLQKVLEKTVEHKGWDNKPAGASIIGRAFKALVKGPADEFLKLGGRFGAFGEGNNDDKDWTINVGGTGFDSTTKALLGSAYLRGDSGVGSYLVPQDWFSEVQRIAVQSSVMANKVRNIDMPTRTLNVPNISTDLSLAWPTDETTTKSESAPVFGANITLSAKTCAGWLSVTDELEEDSAVPLGTLFTELFSERWGREIDTQILVANTAPFVGITRNTGVNSVTMTGNTDFAAVTWQHLLDMENAISVAKGETALQGAVWIMHRKVFNYLRAKTDDMGNPIYQKPADGVPAQLYGHPYILSDVMPYTNATATGFIILGNPKYWAWGSRIGMEVKRFDSTSYGMQNDQIFYRFRVRAGFVGLVPAAFSVLKTG